MSTDADGYKAVNCAQLAPVLIEAPKARAAAAKTHAAQAAAAFEAWRRLEAAIDGHARK